MKGLVLSMLALTVGCTVGPNYKRPDYPLPPAFRAQEQEPAGSLSLGDRKWVEIFRDDALRSLIQAALVENYDVRMAAERILQARGALQATRGGMFPSLDATPGSSRQSGFLPAVYNGSLVAQVSWDLDLWGKYRRATEAARADLLATAENRNAVYQSLVADLATAYFQLRSLDEELTLNRETLAFRQESLRLVRARLGGGVATRLDEDQANSLVLTTAENIALLEKAAEQTENQITILLGRNPGPVTRGATLAAQEMPADVPAGLPSSLLERRPDIRAAEQQLIAANARIGVAKAAFFPNISLTGSSGYQLYDAGIPLTNTSGGAVSIGANSLLPIFDAGRRMGNYRATQARQRELVLNYQRAIQQALHDVSDAEIGYRKAREYRAQAAAFAETLRHQSRLSTMRYRGGVTSYLEVLDTERQRLGAEQSLILAQRDELISLVALYRALGGGWQEAAAAAGPVAAAAPGNSPVSGRDLPKKSPPHF